MTDANTTATNHAFVFIKPHAVGNAAIEALVRERLRAARVRLTAEGTVGGDRIRDERLIDRHYATIARYALDWPASKAQVGDGPQGEFERTFGLPWAEAVAKGAVLNAREAAERYCGGDLGAVGAAWDAAATSPTVKLAPGLSVKCVRLGQSEDGVLVLNGFYLANRAKYVESTASVHWFTAEWDEAALTWASFRADVIGATNPARAAPGSIRGSLFADPQRYGMAAPPTMSDNGVHASAGPLEGVAERRVWLGTDLASDPTGAAMMSAGVSAEFLEAALDNPSVIPADGGSSTPLFDLLEDTQTSDAIPRLVRLAAATRR